MTCSSTPLALSRRQTSYPHPGLLKAGTTPAIHRLPLKSQRRLTPRPEQPAPFMARRTAAEHFPMSRFLLRSSRSKRLPFVQVEVCPIISSLTVYSGEHLIGEARTIPYSYLFLSFLRSPKSSCHVPNTFVPQLQRHDFLDL